MNITHQPEEAQLRCYLDDQPKAAIRPLMLKSNEGRINSVVTPQDGAECSEKQLELIPM